MSAQFSGGTVQTGILQTEIGNTDPEAKAKLDDPFVLGGRGSCDPSNSGKADDVIPLDTSVLSEQESGVK